MHSSIKKVVVFGNTFSLSREGDFAGETGNVLRSITPRSLKPKGNPNELHIGCRVMCGNRDYWWLTTPIREFISVEDNIVIFRTDNSVYTLTSK